MSIDAIVMMIVAMVLLWGGLAAALINLNRGSEPDEPLDGGGLHRDL